MKKIALVLFLFQAVPVPAAIIYVDSTKTGGADDGTSCTDAYLLLQTALTNWTTSDVVYVDVDHAETAAAATTYTAVNDSEADAVPIYSVDCSASDAYTVATAAQMEVTSGNILHLALHFKGFGLWFKAVGTVNEEIRAITFPGFECTDCIFEVDTNGPQTCSLWGINNTSGTPAARFVLINSELRQSGTGDCTWRILNNGRVAMRGGSVTGDVASAGAFGASSPDEIVPFEFNGVDFGGLGSETLFDLSTCGNYACQVTVSGSEFPTAFTLSDGAYGNDADWVSLVATDDAGLSFIREWHGLRGDVAISSSVYHDAGFVFDEGTTTASYELDPNADTHKWAPICTPPIDSYNTSTAGSVSIELEVVENFTAALDQSDLWLEVRSLNTASETLVTWSNPRGELLGSTPLAAGAGCGNWTGEPATCRSSKLEASIAFRKEGPYQARACLGTEETGKLAYVDPLITTP